MATIHQFPREARPPAGGVFASFEDVMAFELPTPVYFEDQTPGDAAYSPEDQARLAAFFSWFGFDVDAAGDLESLAAGWSFLGSEIGSAAAYQRKHPDTFQALHGDWSQDQLDYLAAVVSGDIGAARALAFLIPLGAELAKAMSAVGLRTALRR